MTMRHAHTLRTLSRLLATAAVCAPCAAPAAASDTRLEVIDRSLLSRVVDAVEWNADSLTTRNDEGALQATRLDGVLAVVALDTNARWKRPSADEIAGGTPVVIELVDGQRFIGSIGPWDSTELSIAAAAADPAFTPAPGGPPAAPSESLAMLARGATPRAIPLERIGRIVLDPWRRLVARSESWDAPTDDELIYQNGDRARGFLVTIADGSIVFDTGSGERTIPTDRVAEIRLGNQTTPHHGVRTWYQTGEIRNEPPIRSASEPAIGSANGPAGLDQAERDPSTETKQSAPLEASEISAAWLDRRVRIPLADVELIAAEPGAARRWSRGPVAGSGWAAPLGAADIEIDGPQHTRWRVPPGSSAFSARVVLGATIESPDAPPGPWADAIFRISIETDTEIVELGSWHLSPSQSAVFVRVELPDPAAPRRALIIDLLEGRYGPIQDNVLIRRPFMIGAEDPDEGVTNPG